MATWPVHILTERKTNNLLHILMTVGPDLPFAAAIAKTRMHNSKGRVIQQTEIAFRIHRLLHSPAFVGLLLLLIAVTRGKKDVYCILLRHVLLDYLTHSRAWRKVMWR